MKNRTLARNFLVCCAVVSSYTAALAQADPRAQLLHAIRFGELNRAQIERDCRDNPAFSSTAQLRALCAKRYRIPAEVSENAALPFLKSRMSADLAAEALRFWNSETGRALSAKIIREIETGRYDQLSDRERRLAKEQDETPYGVVLISIADDREVGRAVARAVVAYEP